MIMDNALPLGTRRKERLGRGLYIYALLISSCQGRYLLIFFTCGECRRLVLPLLLAYFSPWNRLKHE